MHKRQALRDAHDPQRAAQQLLRQRHPPRFGPEEQEAYIACTLGALLMSNETGTNSERSAATGPETSFRSASSQGCPYLMLAVGHKLYSERAHR